MLSVLIKYEPRMFFNLCTKVVKNEPFTPDTIGIQS